MPKLCAKVEGSGNGIKTVITNMSAVARALGRPPSYPTKYFGCELGAQVTMANDIYVVNGAHDVEKLQSLLYNFIRKFVLCNKCNNPETTLSLVKDGIRQKCIACGYDTTIPKAVHKLTTFIANHPPDGSIPSSKSKSSEKKASKSKSKSANQQDSTSPSAKAQTENSADQFADDDFGDDDFDDQDLSAAAYKQRMRELTEGLQAGMYSGANAKESANVFYSLLKEKKEANELHEASAQKELVAEAAKLNLSDKATLILCELLFTENIIEEIKQYRMLLLRFCHENRKAQKYLLGGFEKLVGDMYQDKLLNSVAKILKQFYDEDVLEEEAIFEWAAKESKKYVSKEMSRKIREKAAPLVKWLKEADVDSSEDEEEEESEQEDEDKSDGSNRKESEEDEEEDDDIDLEFSHRVQGIKLETVSKEPPAATLSNPTTNAAQQNGADEDAEDLDIDNI